MTYDEGFPVMEWWMAAMTCEDEARSIYFSDPRRFNLIDVLNR